mmetsp:Transcript_8032/g.11385  ORF Transcript_8032/g.11385 Transcript_8032/m.11385 type:complete len:88 (-) Transcript_8032:206-469(-)
MLSDTTVVDLPPNAIPLQPVVNPALFFLYWSTLVTLGIGAMGYFFIYIVSTPVKSRDLKREMILALLSSICLGYGCLFLLLWAGVWV